jgi:hypothetical protein
MSEHWEVYACQMGDDTAFILYDHGIRENINNIACNTFVSFLLEFKVIQDNGFPTPEELKAADKVEDELASFITANKGHYVGRVTVAGKRYFNCYCSLSEQDIASFISNSEQQYGYPIRFYIKEDPDKEGYWQELFPSPEDWQVCKDLKVITQLEQAGDSLEKPRLIRHWAYFPNEQQAKAFANWAECEGYNLESYSAPNEHSNDYGVRISHMGKPTLSVINHHTITLMHQASALGGDYDGWETSVEKDGA